MEAFANQLDRLGGASTEVLNAWHWLTACEKGDGFDLVFSTLGECHASSIPADLASIGLAVPFSATEGYGQNGRPTGNYGLHRLQFRAAPAFWPSLPERDECEHSQNFARRSITAPCQNRGPAKDGRKTPRIRPRVGGQRRLRQQPGAPAPGAGLLRAGLRRTWAAGPY